MHRDHAATKLFPELEGNEFDALVNDIRRNGQKQPILLFDGQVIDGRNRMRVCKILKIKPITEEIDTDDPLGFVMSLNYHRRHLRSHEKGAALRYYLIHKGGQVGKNKGGRPSKNGKKPTHRGSVSVTSIAKQLGIPQQTAQRQIKAAETYAELPRPVQRKVDAGECPIEIAPQVAAKLEQTLLKIEDPLPAEIQEISDRTAERHRRISATNKWLHSVESGCRFHAEFISSNRWSAAQKQMLHRVAKVMKQFSKTLEDL